MPKAALCLACLYMAGCGIIGPDLEAPNRTRLNPLPSKYAEWYVESQRCAGKSRDFTTISWFVSDELFFGGTEIAGVWSWPSRIIMRSDFLHSRRAVKHEMIHYVMRKGNALHETDVFDRCTSS